MPSPVRTFPGLTYRQTEATIKARRILNEMLSEDMPILLDPRFTELENLMIKAFPQDLAMGLTVKESRALAG